MAPLMLPTIALFLALPLPITAQTYSNISSGQSLTAGDGRAVWPSPSGDFAFGFQRMKSGGFLLAIWFNKIAENTIVWSANGGSLAPKGSRVQLATDGRLVLSDPKREVIWNTPSPSGSRVVYAALLDSGNFVLAIQDNFYHWESFNHPSDTILPSQILSQGTKLVARYSDSNYSMGRFQFGMQDDGNLVLYTTAFPTDSTLFAYWFTDTAGSGYQVVFNQDGKINLTRRNGSMLYPITSTSLPTGSFYQRAILEYDGVIRQYIYPKNGNNSSLGRPVAWDMVASPVPTNICMRVTQKVGPGACGFNSYCFLGDDPSQRPQCNCPPGYTYIDPDNEMNGCKQKFEPQKCDPVEKDDQFTFHEMINADWPYSDYESFRTDDEDSCRESCLNDCFCALVIFNDRGCWKKRMPFSSGRVDPAVGGKALIKVRKDNTTTLVAPSPGREREAPRKKKDLITIGWVLLSSSAALNCLLIFSTLLIWFRLQHRRDGNSLQPCTVNQGMKLQQFTYNELKDATDGFRDEVGKGASGAVYRGVITSPDGRRLVAVKVLTKMTREEKEFRAEVSTVGRANHRNLAQLLGFCYEGQSRLLVYEFMRNGSLASNLFGATRLSWYRRAEIASGVARGLLYLHEDCSKQIIHCDIKPENILLDDSLTPKISDFGVAKLLKTEQSQTETTIRGTRGYLAPEWFRNMSISVKVDVYSFGILLLEIVCCRKNCEQEANEEAQIMLPDWVCNCFNAGKLDLLVHGDEEALNDMTRVERFVMIATWCIQQDPSLRPTMKKTIQMLEGAVQVSVPPDPFSFISSI